MAGFVLKCSRCGLADSEPLFHDAETEQWRCPRCSMDESGILVEIHPELQTCAYCFETFDPILFPPRLMTAAMRFLFEERQVRGDVEAKFCSEPCADRYGLERLSTVDY